MLIAAAALLAAPPVLAQDCAARLLPPSELVGPKRPITLDDLIGLRDFGPANDVPGVDPLFALSPDGQEIALLLRRADPVANRTCIGLLIYRFDTGAVRVVNTGGDLILTTADFRGFADWTTGAVIGGAPVWSPDGHWIAWLRRDAGVTRLWRLRSDGTDAAPVTSEPLDVRRFAWREDGALVYEVRPALAEALQRIEAEGRSGHLYDERFWPMSETVPFAAQSIPYAVMTLVPGGTPSAATPEERRGLGVGTDPRLPAGVVRSAITRTAVAWLRLVDPARFLGPQRLEAELGGRRFACDAPACARDLLGMWWLEDGELMFLRDWGSTGGGVLELFRWRPGGRLVSVLRTTAALHGCLLRGEELVCGHEAATEPRRIVAIAPATGRVRTIFDPNPEFVSIRLGSVERLAARAGDGTRTFADLVLPPDHRPGQRHPLVIVQYTSRGFLRGGTGDEYPIQALAARGYAVLSFQRPKPPAADMAATSVNAYQRNNVIGWADRRRVFSALDALVDSSIATGAVDPARIGITGLSDGAATVDWALVNSKRFKAAVMSGCCEDPATVNYSNGLAYLHDARQWGYPPPGPEDEAFWAPYSLVRNAARVDTPILIQTADRQYRMALATVAALKEAGKPIEMYVFPNEYHVKWQPAHRLAVYRRVIDWFDFWLLGREDPSGDRVNQYRRWRAMRASMSAPGAPGL